MSLKGQPSYDGKGYSAPESDDGDPFLGANEHPVQGRGRGKGRKEGEEWEEEALQLEEGEVEQEIVEGNVAVVEEVVLRTSGLCGEFLVQTHRKCHLSLLKGLQDLFCLIF